MNRISPAFPALLDSGNNTDSYFHEHHLVYWAGLSTDNLETLGTVRIHGQSIPQCMADLWIHPNIPGTFKRHPNRKPFRVRLPEGIAVGLSRPNQVVVPRVPLLGFSALYKNKLDYWFDSKKGHSYLRTSGWRSRLIRWLL